MSRCILEYWRQHASQLRRADSESRNSVFWLEFFPNALVKDIRPPRQREFLNHLKSKRFAKSTIEGIFKTGSAAINWAWKNDMLLHQLPIISPAKELKSYKAPAKQERWRALEQEEVIAMFECSTTDRLKRFLMVLIACACRPSAALELEGCQIDLEAKTIDLLRPGSEQNNKYRPVVRLPYFIEAIYHEHNICSQGVVCLNPDKPMDSIKTSWNTARKKANLSSQVVPYSIRHTMARWLRKRSVAAWHTSSQLGHTQRGHEITELYAPHDPGYLDDALNAIEGYFNDLRSASRTIDDFVAASLRKRGLN